MTENYYVFLEQPLAINVATLLAAKLQNKPLVGALKFYPDELCRFYIISKADGKCLPTVLNADTFFCFHHVNAYEEQGLVINRRQNRDNIGLILSSTFTLKWNQI